MRIAKAGFAICFMLAVSGQAFGQTPPPTFGVPNLSPAPPLTPPIQIESCTTPEVGGLLIARSTGEFKVTFTNEGAVEADLIRFQIDFGPERLFIRDVGKFQPGVTVTHKFKRRGGNVVTSPLFGNTKFYCSVASTHFTDGSLWSLPNPNAPTPQVPIASTPMSLAGDGYIGVQMTQSDAGIAIHLVLPSGPADKAGLRQGDLIFQIARQHVASLAEAITLISATPPGTTLTITVIRDGVQQTLAPLVSVRPPGTNQQ
jgi:hypothetical protein